MQEFLAGDENGNRNEIDDNVNGGDDDLLYARDNKGRIIQTDDGSNNAFKQDEYQKTVDMDKMDQNLLDLANGILGIPKFNNSALVSSKDQDDNLSKIINSVTGVRNNNLCTNNSNQEDDINDIMSNSATQSNKADNPPALSDILHRSNTYTLGQNEAKDIQRTASDGAREYENKSYNENKTVVSDADTHETHESRGSVSEAALQNDRPIPSPAPTKTVSLTGRGNMPSFNLHGVSGIQFHNQGLSMISINSSASKRVGAHNKHNTLISLSPRKGFMITSIERTNKFSIYDIFTLFLNKKQKNK